MGESDPPRKRAHHSGQSAIVGNVAVASAESNTSTSSGLQLASNVETSKEPGECHAYTAPDHSSKTVRVINAFYSTIFSKINSSTVASTYNK